MEERDKKTTFQSVIGHTIPAPAAKAILLPTHTMKKQITFLSALCYLLCNGACEPDNNHQATDNDIHSAPAFLTVAEHSFRQAKLYPIDPFIVPDSVKTPLLIAAYDEHIPQHGRTVLIYTDSAMTDAIKISYTDASVVKTESLLKIRPNEFKSKFSSETYMVTADKVYWGNSIGATSTSYEYIRMDNKWNQSVNTEDPDSVPNR